MSIVSNRKSTEDLEREIAELEKQELNPLTEEEEGDESLKADEEDQAIEDKQEESTEEESSKTKEDKDESSFKKRYGDLRRYSQTLKDEIKKLKEEKNKAEVRPLASDETVAEWKEKFPDIASIVETVADQIAQQKFDKARMDMDEIQEFQKESAKDKAISQIKKTHKDFEKITGSDEFHDWTEDQPKWVQDALFVNSDDARSVIRAIDLYKLDKGMTKEDTTRKTKEAAKSVSTKSSPSVRSEPSAPKYSESIVERMSITEYEEHEKEIMEAQRKGEFLYDMTGGAR